MKIDCLNNAITYLCGPIDRVPDAGVVWRKRFTTLIKERNLSIKILDPTNKPAGQISESEVERDYMNRLKAQKKWDELKVFVQNLRRTDLRFVDYSDFVVARVDQSVHMCGTYDEIFLAEKQHKPVLIICEGGKACLPNWLFGVARIDEIFDTVEDCVDYLCKLNSGDIPIDSRWVLVKQYLYGYCDENQEVSVL